MGDAVLIGEVAELFAEWIAGRIGDLRDPRPAVRRAGAHAMRGAALGVGAGALAQALLAIERDPDAAIDHRALEDLAARSAAALREAATAAAGGVVDLGGANR